jgi:hypothetical protein
MRTRDAFSKDICPSLGQVPSFAGMRAGTRMRAQARQLSVTSSPSMKMRSRVPTAVGKKGALRRQVGRA